MKDKLSQAVFGTAFFLLFALLFFAHGCKEKTTNSTNSQESETVDSVQPEDTVMTLEKITELIRENPLNPELFAQRAAIRAANNSFNEAINDLDLAIKLDSLNRNYYVMQAEYYIYNAQPNSAKKGLNNGLRLFPDNTELMLKLAEIHFYLKEYAQAQIILRNVTALNSEIAQIYFLNGLIFLENKDTTNAVRNLQFAVEKDADFYSAFMMLGKIFSNKRDEIAVNYFRSAKDIAPQSYEARYHLALFLQDLERIDEAEAEYYYIIDEIDSTVANPFYNLGYIHLIYKAEFDKALNFFDQAIDRQSDYLEAWYNRGFCNELMGNLKAARKDYEKSLELNPNYTLSIKGLNRIDSGQPFKF